MGFVLVDGYDRYRMYLKDALDKLGVDINVFRVGAYKSAVETYTRTNMSPEDREESRAYLTALWTSYQDARDAGAQACRPDALAKYVDTFAKTVPAAGGDAAAGRAAGGPRHRASRRASRSSSASSSSSVRTTTTDPSARCRRRGLRCASRTRDKKLTPTASRGSA